MSLSALRRLPGTIWVLGIVSMFMDLSSEMVHSLLPVFLVSGLGASPALLGWIEGIAEATASITKVFSGWLSDRLGHRKWLTVLGYGLAALTKPVFPFAVTPYEVLGARFMDRVGKGLRGAPRDALIADITAPDTRGAAYGLRQSLDTIGAFLGPLAAVGLMVLFHDRIRSVFMVAVIPAVFAVVLLMAGVHEPEPAKAHRDAKPAIRWADIGTMGRAFWIAVAIGVLFTMARFSEAFLVLRGADVGLRLALVPVVMIAMNVVYALVAAPVGSWSDTIGRKPLLVAGLVALIAADLVLARTISVGGVMVGAALWGLHMGLSQGLLAALVAATAPVPLRGTAFGVYNLASGVAMLIASALAGLLWSVSGAALTFFTGGGIAVLALVGVLALLREAPRYRKV
jgi:MFS family permease